MTYNHVLTGFLAPFINQLVHSGVRHVVISPGSRSTPLTVLFREHPDITVWMNVDERSAGFFALGLAKGKQEPVALVCSSGTAGANYFPAIIEAKYSEVPLIVLTADRPHELREVGAPQAINQVMLFGTHVKEFVDLPLPESNPGIQRFMAGQAAASVRHATEAPKGPVHLNVPLREPLMPSVDRRISWDHLPVIQTHPLGEYETGVLDTVIQTLAKLERPLIVVGPNEDPALGEVIATLADVFKVPVLADPLSQLRAGRHSKAWVIDGYDAFLREECFKNRYIPDGVIRFGPMPVSKPLLKYIEGSRLSTYVVISEGGRRSDPTHQVTDWIKARPVPFIKKLVDTLKSKPLQVNPSWTEGWLKANRITQDETESLFEKEAWFEGHVIDELLKQLPDRAAVFASNSMPIRDLDSFFLRTNREIRTFGNRGANGIDGINSTALGVSVNGLPTYLIVGDLAFFHDLNGLMMAKRYGLDLTCIVINNNGGGIFSFLPQADTAEHFEELFGTPLAYEVGDVATLHKATYFKAGDPIELREAIHKAKTVKGLKLIECVTNRQENVAIHKNYWLGVANRLTNEL